MYIYYFTLVNIPVFLLMEKESFKRVLEKKNITLKETSIAYLLTFCPK